MMLAVAATGAMALSSCNSFQTITTVDQHYSQARVLDVNTHAKIDTVHAQLRVNPVRVEDSWIFTSDEINALDGKLDKIHARASFKTLQKHSADELLAPLFDVSTNTDGTWTVTVIGYVANIVNWK